MYKKLYHKMSQNTINSEQETVIKYSHNQSLHTSLAKRVLQRYMDILC